MTGASGTPAFKSVELSCEKSFNLFSIPLSFQRLSQALSCKTNLKRWGGK